MFQTICDLSLNVTERSPQQLQKDGKKEVKWQENFSFWFHPLVFLIPFVTVLRSILQNFRRFKRWKTKRFLSLGVFLLDNGIFPSENVAESLFVFRCGKLQLQIRMETSDSSYRCQQKIKIVYNRHVRRWCAYNVNAIAEPLMIIVDDDTMQRASTSQRWQKCTFQFPYKNSPARRLQFFQSATLQLRLIVTSRWLCRFATALKLNIDLTPVGVVSLFLPLQIKHQNCLPIGNCIRCEVSTVHRVSSNWPFVECFESQCEIGKKFNEFFSIQQQISTSLHWLYAEKSLSRGISDAKWKTILNIWESIEFLLHFYALQLLRLQPYIERMEWKAVEWRISRALTRKIEFKWTFIECEKSCVAESGGWELFRESSFVRFSIPLSLNRLDQTE